MIRRLLISALVPVTLIALGACDGSNKSTRNDGGDEERDADRDDDGEPGEDSSTDTDEDAGMDAGDVEDDDASGADASGGDTDAASSACAQSCDDGVDCTADSCEQGTCIHRLDTTLCTAGRSCNPKTGCEEGKACSTQADCADDDGCTVNERCEPATARCVFQPIDRDGDGQAPVSCGGADCNDADPAVSPGATERCDGRDNDCDGQVDENANSCGAGAMCTEGACACQANFNACGGGCANFTNDARNCGLCGRSCGTGGVCTAAACSCPAPAKMCGNTCADLTSTAQHCGDCNQICPAVGIMGNPQNCIASACTECGLAGQPCCRAGTGCLPGAVCSGAPGAPGAMCTPAPNCGPDGGPQGCLCGGEGQPCCNIPNSTTKICLSARLSCGANSVCAAISGGGAGGGPGAGG